MENEGRNRPGPPGPSSARPPLIVVFGIPGCGKTTLLRRLSSAWPAGRVWAFNPSADPALHPFPEWDLDRPPPLRGTFLIADDFGLLMQPWEWHSPKPRHKWLKRAILLHRHNNTTLALAAHSVTDIHPSMRYVATDVYAGQIHGHEQVRRLCLDWSEELAQVPELPPFEFLHVTL